MVTKWDRINCVEIKRFDESRCICSVFIIASQSLKLSHEVLGDFHLYCKSTDSCFLVLQVNHNKEPNRADFQFGFHSCETVSYFALELVHSSCLNCSFCGSAEWVFRPHTFETAVAGLVNTDRMWWHNNHRELNEAPFSFGCLCSPRFLLL